MADSPLQTTWPNGDPIAAILTRKEAARYLRCSEPSIDRYSRQGLITRLKAGHATRYERADLDRFLREGSAA